MNWPDGDIRRWVGLAAVCVRTDCGEPLVTRRANRTAARPRVFVGELFLGDQGRAHRPGLWRWQSPGEVTRQAFLFRVGNGTVMPRIRAQGQTPAVESQIEIVKLLDNPG